MSRAISRQITSLSPISLARIAAVIGILEGVAAVNGQLRIPGRLIVAADPAATAANILSHESLFRLGLLLCALAVALNLSRTALFYVLFRPASRIAALLAVLFALVAYTLQASGVLLQLPVLILLKSGKDFAAFNLDQLQSMTLLFLRWSGAAFNFYLAFFGLLCVLVGYVAYKSTFVPRIVGFLEMIAGVGYSTYFWPPLANYLYPYNLALGVGELALGFWLVVFGVNVERWKEQAALDQ